MLSHNTFYKKKKKKEKKKEKRKEKKKKSLEHILNVRIGK